MAGLDPAAAVAPALRHGRAWPGHPHRHAAMEGAVTRRLAAGMAGSTAGHDGCALGGAWGGAALGAGRRLGGASTDARPPDERSALTNP